MKVLVTGATGYIGAVAADALAATGTRSSVLPARRGPRMPCADVASSPPWETSAIPRV